MDRRTDRSTDRGERKKISRLTDRQTEGGSWKITYYY